MLIKFALHAWIGSDCCMLSWSRAMQQVTAHPQQRGVVPGAEVDIVMQLICAHASCIVGRLLGQDLGPKLP